jgi:hypothetical protein
VTDHQRILVVSTDAGAADVARVRERARDATVLAAPTAEAKRVVEGLGRTPVADVLLAPVRFPEMDRGHRLDALVRRHAVVDRYRDVVVVADQATVTLLLRVLAPDQLPEPGPVTEVGLPRGPRPLPLGRAAVGGVALALVTGLLSAVVPPWVLPVLTLLAGTALALVPSRRHIGLAMVVAVGTAAIVSLLAIAGSSRFPGYW